MVAHTEPLQVKPVAQGTDVPMLQVPALHVGAGVATELVHEAEPQLVVG